MRFLSLILLAIGFAGTAHARIAKIRWDKVANALRYEIKILQGGETIVKSVTESDDPSWRGGLSPGYFTYQIRAIDKSELAGEWTKPHLILVKPNAAQVMGPGGNAAIRLTETEGRLFLKWRPMGKRIRYQVDIKTETVKYQRIVFEKGEYEIENPTSGYYQWRVTPLIQAEGSVDKSVLGTYEPNATGDVSSWYDFTLELDATYLKAKQRFIAPHLQPLPPKQPVPYGQVVTVRWDGVEAAEAYEVRYTMAPKNARFPSPEERRVFSAVVQKDYFSVPVQDGKKYEVSVRALSHIDKRGLASIVSPDGKVQFEVDDGVPPPKPPSYLFARSSIAPYRDSRVVPSQSYSGDIEGAGVAVDLGARHYWTPWLQSELSFLQEVQDVENTNDVRTEQKLFTHYVWNVGGVEQGLRVRLGLGLGFLTYTVLSPNVQASAGTTVVTTSRTHYTNLVVIPALEVEQQLTNDLSLGVELRLPSGLKAFTGSAVSAMKLPLGSNWRAQATLRWDVGAGFLFEFFVGQERRTLNYTLNGTSGEESKVSATRGGLGISYEW